MQSLAKKFRDYRKRLKNGHYLKWETDEDRLGHPPPNVSMDDWTWLVQYWSSPKAQAVAERNKINRSHQTLKHTGGTKSFAHYIDEEDGVGLGLMGVCLLERTSSSAPIHKKMGRRLMTDKRKSLELSRTPEDGSCSSIGDDIYTQVMGPERHGRVRGYGLGPTPSVLAPHQANLMLNMRRCILSFTTCVSKWRA